MFLDDYQEAAVKLAIYPRFEGNLNFAYPALGLIGEAGEVSEKIKKGIRDGVLNRHEVAKELGDVLWYLSVLAHEMGYSLDGVARMNLDKLNSRKARDKLHGEGDNR